MVKHSFLAAVFLFIILKISGAPWIDAAVWTLLFYSLYTFISGLTYRIGILSAINVIACLVYLVFPLLAFNVFNQSHALAFRWKSFMVIDKADYFSFALPGTILLILGLGFPFGKYKKISDVYLLRRVRLYLHNKSFIGFLFIFIGLICSVIVPFLGESIKAIVYFFSQLTFVGAIYLLHSDIKSKKLILLVILSLLVVQVVLTGMYGELIFWGLLGTMILLVGNTKVSLFKRIALMMIGMFLILLIQSVKHEYRDKVWKGAERGNDPGFLFQLVRDRILDPSSIVSTERLYNLTVRGNQGFLVARAMDYVPRHEPFAAGETILNSIISSVVPRLFWRDKPRVGGHENICRFLGDCGKYNYSYNIGQLGEAYVNFGKTGGAIFMFFYGLFINWCFYTIKGMSLRHPTLILWIPLLFYAVLSLETDVLTFLNSFIKGCIFCWICFMVFRYLFKIRI
ncbi:MAG TPA: hypothetical protein VFG10_09485 [Saprospiraceae bacterium]|nr:hypothetical protein [Saprospiraceae bacterium]